ncbi:hypothetical protein NP493_88g05022 [Ridgeia piscesae]|uniref:Uncharacterized protein n=1 Tax=Ridgeia piscesae TaxID=27915 RepID=A0AAD9P8H2_RIDPI|nr:hypothetical protein NP493_88g05022 [Ridgeia piscesae]
MRSDVTSARKPTSLLQTRGHVSHVRPPLSPTPNSQIASSLHSTLCPFPFPRLVGMVGDRVDVVFLPHVLPQVFPPRLTGLEHPEGIVLGELAPSPRHEDEEHDDEEGDDEQPDDEAEDQVWVVETRLTRRTVARVCGGRGPGWNETQLRGEVTERPKRRD